MRNNSLTNRFHSAIIHPSLIIFDLKARTRPRDSQRPILLLGFEPRPALKVPDPRQAGIVRSLREPAGPSHSPAGAL